MVTNDDVRNAYRLILGREPENDQVVEEQRNHADLAALRRHFLASDEFRIKEGGGRHPSSLGGYRDQIVHDIEWECAPDVLQEMLSRTSEVWTTFGEEAPHWSVLVNEEFKPGTIDQNIDKFYKTGLGDVDICLNSLRRAGVRADRFERALDFGCGVGRLSLALAGLADHVTSIDVSAGHLKLARERAAQTGVENVEWVQLKDLRDLGQFKNYDLVLSLIVLQHNPPPVMAFAFRALLGALKPGGFAVIQIPTYIQPVFKIETYLAHASGEMEMHALPQSVIYKIIDEEGCVPVEIREDESIGPIGVSQNFTIMKKRT
ncbi:methyltransferase domain-containing protein [Pseudomonas sp. ODNR1LW]|nr:methyltransferase domain-containing protein [Pseudomonas sp. ODNR1LW]